MMKVNLHLEKVGSFWMMINPYYRKWWFVNQPAKDFQGIPLFRVKRLNETIHYSYSLQIWEIRDTFEQSW